MMRGGFLLAVAAVAAIQIPWITCHSDCQDVRTSLLARHACHRLEAHDHGESGHDHGTGDHDHGAPEDRPSRGEHEAVHVVAPRTKSTQATAAAPLEAPAHEASTERGGGGSAHRVPSPDTAGPDPRPRPPESAERRLL